MFEGYVPELSAVDNNFPPEISIIWYRCSEALCDYKTKHKGNIKQHLAAVHDVGITMMSEEA